MSMIPTFKDLQGGPATTSGIVEKFDGKARVVPESRRPDGTLRKERKIRPGYSPAEDALKFKSTRMQDAESKALPKGAVVGRPAPSAASVAIANAHLTAAARKNAKRKEKRKAGGDEEADGKVEVAPPDDWDADDPDEAKPATVPTAAEDETAHDPEKRARALQKKIKQAEQLKEKASKGDALLPEQTAKVDSLPSLLAELEGLSLGSSASSRNGTSADGEAPAGEA